MKKIPDPGKFSVSPLYKRASVKLMHMLTTPHTATPAPYAPTLEKLTKLLSGNFTFFNKSIFRQF